jgi:GxxExxY protein
MERQKENIEDPLTYKIIGCAMKVHSTLGNGFQEVIYQRALAIELNKAGLSFAREVEMDIYYEGENIGTRRVDLLVRNQNIGGVKSIDAIRGCTPGARFKLSGCL